MGKSGENRRRAKIRERMAEAAKSASPARETPRGARGASRVPAAESSTKPMAA